MQNWHANNCQCRIISNNCKCKIFIPTIIFDRIVLLIVISYECRIVLPIIVSVLLKTLLYAIIKHKKCNKKWPLHTQSFVKGAQVPKAGGSQYRLSQKPQFVLFWNASLRLQKARQKASTLLQIYGRQDFPSRWVG